MLQNIHKREQRVLGSSTEHFCRRLRCVNRKSHAASSLLNIEAVDSRHPPRRWIEIDCCISESSGQLLSRYEKIHSPWTCECWVPVRRKQSRGPLTVHDPVVYCVQSQMCCSSCFRRMQWQGEKTTCAKGLFVASLAHKRLFFHAEMEAGMKVPCTYPPREQKTGNSSRKSRRGWGAGGRPRESRVS